MAFYFASRLDKTVLWLVARFSGFCATIWIAAFMFKSNDIVRKQTALKVLLCTIASYSLNQLFWMMKTSFSFECRFTVIKELTFPLQGERRIFILTGISILFTLHVVGIYWWYRNDDLLYPLLMLPPRTIPPFWHAIFIIMVNGMFFAMNTVISWCGITSLI